MTLWIDDPSVLFDTEKLKYYIPGPHLTWEEQANALVRFMIYLSLIMYLYYNNPMALIIPPMLMMGIQYYYHQRGQLSSSMISIFQGQIKTPGEKVPVPEGNSTLTTNQIQLAPTTNITNTKEKFSQPLQLRNPYFEDAKKTMEERAAMQMNDQRFIETIDHPDQIRPDMGLQKEPPFREHVIECKAPTIDNPFGNSMPYDTIERQISKSCPDEFAKDQKFYGKLFNNLDDLFDRNNSQREFTTNPSSTRINDREAAIQFFYNTPYTEH